MPIMKKIVFVLSTAVTVVVLLGAQPARAQDLVSGTCSEIRPKSTAEAYIPIRKSGCYRLGESLHVGWKSSFSEGRKKISLGYAAMIFIEPLSTEIDLASLKLSSETGDGAIVARGSRGDGSKWAPFAPNEFHRVVIRNGTIDIRNSDGGRTNKGILIPKEAQDIHQWSSNPDPIPAPFRKVEYLLENLTIKAGAAAALMMGDGITIRNCTIEVEGENALVIYGPNAVIENNRIVYRYSNADPHANPNRQATASYPEHHAAIYLRAADNAVVRGNTITVSGSDSSAKEPLSAVAVIDSKGVRVEANQFNLQTPVLIHGASSAVLKANQAKVGWLGKQQALPDQELK
jgi:hypothetical protein